MSDPSLPTDAAELSALVVRLRATNSGLREVIAGQAEQMEALAARIAELERRLSSDSSTSSKPPSSDPPYRKPARRSSRGTSERKPGKQPGQPGSTMPLVDDPDEIIVCDPGSCGDCGADLSGAPVTATTRRQVTDVLAPPPPRVTEYRIVTRSCPCCATAQTGLAPVFAPARAQYGPGVLARSAELLCGHYLPVARASRLMGSMVGVEVSTGFMAGVRGRAARLLETSFLPRVRELLRQVGVLHVDETPARADGALSYVHVACTEFLTAMHTGGRSKADIDAGNVLPGYTGMSVGYRRPWGGSGFVVIAIINAARPSGGPYVDRVGEPGNPRDLTRNQRAPRSCPIGSASVGCSVSDVLAAGLTGLAWTGGAAARP